MTKINYYINRFEYKKEIDVLRFISVLSVILFHLDVEYFKGGFLGVDIFFIISGYLITNIILSDLNIKKFSLKNFYLRRARRILPALFIVLFFTIIFGFIFLFPEEINYLNKTILSILFFVSNFFFFKTTDYFDDMASQSPLLHTWSLSVEEQFYVVYPIFIFIFFKYFSLDKFKLVLIFLFAASLSLAIYSHNLYPDANFFFTPTRSFEIILGCILAISKFKIKIFKYRQFLIDIICVLSFAAIIFSFCFFSKEDLLPNAKTLIPLISTCILILFLRETNKFIYYLFSNSVFVYLGKISYSMYLIHIPLLLFMPIDKSGLSYLFYFFTLLALSYLSYKFIEQPFRQKGRVKNKTFIFIILSSLLSIIILSYLSTKVSNSNFKRDLIKIFSSEKNSNIYNQIYKVKQQNLEVDDRIFFNECVFSTIKIAFKDESKFRKCIEEKNDKFIIFLGDSHARDLFVSFAKVTNYKMVMGLLPQGCRPASLIKTCIDKYNEFKDFILNNRQKIRLVIYSQQGSKLLKFKSPSELDQNKTLKTLDYLSDLNLKTNLLWIGPNIEPNIKMNYSLIKIIINEKYNLYENKYIYKVNDEIKKIALKNEIKYLDRIKIIDYSPLNDFYHNGNLTYRDRNHWSEYGHMYFGKKLYLNKKFNYYIKE